MLDEIHKFIRTKVPFAENDRVFADDIEKGIHMIQHGEIINLVEKNHERQKTCNGMHLILNEFEIY